MSIQILGVFGLITDRLGAEPVALEGLTTPQSRQQAKIRSYRTQVRGVLATLEEQLGVVPFLGGQSYSIADIATFPWARGVGTFLGKPAEADYPKLMAWVAKINSRPAVTRALAAVDEVRAKTTQFDKAADGAKDRLLSRGRHAA
jgi:GST-like protein